MVSREGDCGHILVQKHATVSSPIERRVSPIVDKEQLVRAQRLAVAGDAVEEIAVAAEIVRLVA
jgi:hypothetical protein